MEKFSFLQKLMKGFLFIFLEEDFTVKLSQIIGLVANRSYN